MSNAREGEGPFAGRLVLDVTHVLAGSHCGLLLSLMSAEVLKVERASSRPAGRPVIPSTHGTRRISIV